MTDAGSRGPPPVRVGVLGGGQLGRMLALAGLPLGLRFRFLEPRAAPTVGELGEVVAADYGDAEALGRFVDGLALVTYEFENVPVETARRLERELPVLPPPQALEAAQDRWIEKETFRTLGIPTAPYHAVDSREALDRAVRALGLPAVLKTRRMGYDGKGQAVLRSGPDVEEAWARLGDRPLLLEGFVDFRRELSCLAVRSRSGETRVYPLAENEHRGGILRESRVPAPDLPPAVQPHAEMLVGRLLDHLDYVGVLAVELFDAEEGLLANEMAPRVHNSGHWTQDGAETSQFENHLRAILGLPLGGTAVRGWAGMVNLIGGVPPREEILGIETARLHLYDKAPRPGRKVGHVNVTGAARHELEARLSAVRSLARRWGKG
jgi:5-(carboxyamino)imidazole ribonucleotide synthase